jgi:hypothetical protein
MCYKIRNYLRICFKIHYWAIKAKCKYCVSLQRDFSHALVVVFEFSSHKYMLIESTAHSYVT